MFRAPTILLLAALLLQPLAATAQAPTAAPAGKLPLRWFRIALVHTKAADIIDEMHWHNPTSDGYVFNMPWGVEHVSAEPSDNSLWLRATAEAYAETRGIVRILDQSGYKFAPAMTFLQVPQGDTHLHWVDNPAQGLEVSGPDESIAKAFQELTKTGTKTKTIRLGEWSRYHPIDLIIDAPRLRPDGSLTLDFTYSCWDGPPIEVTGVRSGNVLAVRGARNPQVTLIQVNY